MIETLRNWGGRRAFSALRRLFLWVVSAPLLLQPTQAQAVEVDLTLVLAVDVSHSIDIREVMLQREGYISALQHPSVLGAIEQGEHGRIAVAYFEWADANKQSLIVDWMIIADAESARRFAQRLRPAPVVKGHFTSISAAIGFATGMLDRTAFRSSRRVIDISGDGKNNDGPPLEVARSRALQESITINGLPIVDLSGFIHRGTPPVRIDQYYRDHVIAGAEAFTIVVKDPADFETAINRKLLREIAKGAGNRTLAHILAE